MTSARPARFCSTVEREAMKIERDADDVCLAFLLERRLAEARASEDPTFEGEVVGLTREGRLRAFRRRGLRGHAAGQAPAPLVDAERGGAPPSRPRARGGGCDFGDTVEVTVDRVETARGRVDLSPAGAYSDNG